VDARAFSKPEVRAPQERPHADRRAWLVPLGASEMVSTKQADMLLTAIGLVPLPLAHPTQ